jgi:hypothetical protein
VFFFYLQKHNAENSHTATEHHWYGSNFCPNYRTILMLLSIEGSEWCIFIFFWGGGGTPRIFETAKSEGRVYYVAFIAQNVLRSKRACCQYRHNVQFAIRFTVAAWVGLGVGTCYFIARSLVLAQLLIPSCVPSNCAFCLQSYILHMVTDLAAIIYLNRVS